MSGKPAFAFPSISVCSLPAAREALIHPRSLVRVSCTCDLPHTSIRRPLSILPTSQEELMEPRDAK